MKHEKLERLIKLGLTKEVERVKAGKCPQCGEVVKREELRDVLSITEFYISGLDQKCQDEVFGR